MTTETQRYLELLEQRIALLGSLAASLTAASVSLVSFDVDTLEERITEQEKLCASIGSLDTEIDAVQRRCQSQLVSGAPQEGSAAFDSSSYRLRETILRLNQAQSAVKQLNDAHQILLRRSRRTANALLNSYHSFAATYANPAAAQVSAGEGV